MLHLDLIHLVGLDDLNVGHGIGQRFPQVCQRNGIAHRQTVDVPKIIRAFPTSVSGNDAVGAIATDGCRCVSKHRCTCGKVSVGRAQIDRHGQLHSRYLQHADDLILDAVGSQVGGGFFAGFKVGEVALLFCVKLSVVLL